MLPTHLNVLPDPNRIGNDCLDDILLNKKHFIGILAIWLTVAVLVFGHQIRTNSDIVVKHHSFLWRLSVIAMAEFIVHYLSLIYTNNHCADSVILQISVIALRTIRDMAFILMIISLSNGWGITFSVISKTKWIAFKKIGSFMLIPSFVSAYTVVTTDFMFESIGNVPKIAIAARIIMQFVFCGLMVSSLNTIRRRGLANDKRWDERLSMFKRILIGCHVWGLIHLSLSLLITNQDVNWRYEWIRRFGIWDILFVVLLTAMMVIWRPMSNDKKGYRTTVLDTMSSSRTNDKEHIMEMDELLDFDLGIGSDVEIEDLGTDFTLPGAREHEIEEADNSMKDVDLFWV